MTYSGVATLSALLPDGTRATIFRGFDGQTYMVTSPGEGIKIYGHLTLAGVSLDEFAPYPSDPNRHRIMSVEQKLEEAWPGRILDLSSAPTA